MLLETSCVNHLNVFVTWYLCNTLPADLLIPKIRICVLSSSLSVAALQVAHYVCCIVVVVCAMQSATWLFDTQHGSHNLVVCTRRRPKLVSLLVPMAWWSAHADIPGQRLLAKLQ